MSTPQAKPQSIKIATFNVNSIKARLPNFLAWLKDFGPDVALLQELKCIDENFPRPRRDWLLNAA